MLQEKRQRVLLFLCLYVPAQVLAIAAAMHDENLREREHDENNEQQEQQHGRNIASLEHRRRPC